MSQTSRGFRKCGRASVIAFALTVLLAIGGFANLSTARAAVNPETSITAGPPLFGLPDAIFEFASTSTAPGTTFMCGLDGSAATACQTPHELLNLTDGVHTFTVYSVDPSSNADPTPAGWTFYTDGTPPVVTVTSGPEGKIDIRTPSFGFRSAEPDVIFECRVIPAPFGVCGTTIAEGEAGTSSSYVSSPLADGEHTFQVRATDKLGNRSQAISREFEVEYVPPPPPLPAKLKLGKAKLNKKKGFATIAATVNQAGEVSLVESKSVKAQTASAAAASTISLRVQAVGKALKKLKRDGKVTVTANVVFATAATTNAPSSEASANRRLTLKLTKPKK